MQTNKVFSYYEPVESIDQSKSYNQDELISICRNSWNRAGWNLILLGEKDCLSHPLYEEYSTKVKTLPTINPSLYEYHCFMRWLAMANIGGGIMIDYDVINRGFFPNDSRISFNTLTVYQGHVPCMVSGLSEHYLNFVKSVINHVTNEQHVSDMILLSQEILSFNKMHIVSSFPDFGYLIHCSENTCKNKTKLEIMRICEHFGLTHKDHMVE